MKKDMIKKATIVQTTLYVSEDTNIYRTEHYWTPAIELKIQTEDLQEKVVIVKSSLIDFTYFVLTSEFIPEELNLKISRIRFKDDKTFKERIPQLEGISIRVNIIDGYIVNLRNYTKFFYVYVKNNEVIK